MSETEPAITTPYVETVRSQLVDEERAKAVERVRRSVPDLDEPAVGPDASEVFRLSGWLIREGYIRQVEGLLSPSWRALPERDLTKLLSSQFTEEQLRSEFLRRYPERAAIKARFRKLNILAALVIGLLWARENVENGDWVTATAKFSVVGISAVAVNRLLLARDPAAAAIMAQKAGNFGRWFQGLARADPLITRLTRLGFVSDAATLGLSGGGEFPSIPFDIIIDVDIDNPATWREPDSTLLNLGFNIWYRQACTPAHPEACGGNLYLGKVDGSLMRGIGRALLAVGEGLSTMD